MTTRELKDYALRTLCEEHLWKENEWDGFEYNNVHYLITKLDGCWELANADTHKRRTYPTLGRMFNAFFHLLNIK